MDVDKIVSTLVKVLSGSIYFFLFLGILCIGVLYVPSDWLGKPVSGLVREFVNAWGPVLAFGLYLAPAGLIAKGLEIAIPHLSEVIQANWVSLRAQRLQRMTEQDFGIVRAIYGTSGHYKNVTRRMRAKVRNGRLDITDLLYNDLFGDPHKRNRKTLWVWYHMMGQYDENASIHLPPTPAI